MDSLMGAGQAADPGRMLASEVSVEHPLRIGNVVASLSRARVERGEVRPLSASEPDWRALLGRVECSVRNGGLSSETVVIKSDDDTGGPAEMFIQVPPEPVDDVCRWLQGCKAEALETRMERVENAV
ncbi:MAG: hypothetical protein HZB38_05135 [Planctomycetes bacterium]|nr:hypothetical protein [Planctomycetota bacterium]